MLVEKIILRFGMPLVIHSDQGREFENGLMKSLCALLGCTKTRTAPYHPESDGMIERFNRTCLVMLSMFVNDGVITGTSSCLMSCMRTERVFMSRSGTLHFVS